MSREKNVKQESRTEYKQVFHDTDYIKGYVQGAKRRKLWTGILAKEIKNEKKVPGDPCILDIGTGTGCLCTELSALFPGAKIIGIDTSDEILRYAKQDIHESGLGDKIEYINARVEDMPFADSYFDIITGQFSFSLWEEPVSALKEINRVLKPGGFCFFRNLNGEINDKFLDSFIKATSLKGSEIDDFKNAITHAYSVIEIENFLNQAGMHHYEIRFTEKDSRYSDADSFLLFRQRSYQYNVIIFK
jgi:ubiquinone/menaquinone biosynthesis C-methylase UbiE